MSDSKTSIPADDAKPTPKKSSWRWRFLRFVMLGFFGLVTLFVLFHAVENWRGKRAWEQYRKEQEAKGVSFDFNSIVPPPVPDDKNFAMTPLLKPMLDLNPPGTADYRHKDQAAYARSDISFYPLPPSESERAANDSPSWRLGQRIDLKVWQTAIFDSTNLLHRAEKGMPSEDVLFALKQFDQQMAELHQAARERPLARYDIKYDEENKWAILLPHLARLKGMSKTFQLRAIAYLAQGKADEAFADVNMIFFLADSVKTERLLISHLVRLACYNIAQQAVWEGLADHRWKPEQLTYWQDKLAANDFLKDGHEALEGERLFGNAIIEYIRRNPTKLDEVGDPPKTEVQEIYFNSEKLYQLIPKGWFYLEQINYNEKFQESLHNPPAMNKEQFKLQGFDKNIWEVRLNDYHPLALWRNHEVMSKMLLPALGRTTARGLLRQVTTDLALVAMALEKYYQQHQDYPATLIELEPRYINRLPRDIMASAPFRYERQSKEAYRLWSVGWNLKDDQGLVAKHGRDQHNVDEGDWTWPQVEKAAAAKPAAPAGAFE